MLAAIIGYAILRDRTVAKTDSPVTVYAVQPPVVDPRLTAVVDAVDFDGVPMDRALSEIVHKAGLNYVGRWEPGDDGPGSRPVTMHLRHVTAATALDTAAGF